MLNQIDVLRYLFSIEQDYSKHSSYISDFLKLCSTMLALPETTVAPEVYKVVCKMYVNAAKQSQNLNTIIKSTTECLNKPQYLDHFSQHDFR